jgi:hypothetical protein
MNKEELKAAHKGSALYLFVVLVVSLYSSWHGVTLSEALYYWMILFSFFVIGLTVLISVAPSSDEQRMRKGERVVSEK